MKKTLALLLLLISIVSLFACGKSERKKEFTHGTVTGSTYVSDFADLTLTVPASWRFYSDEELAESMNVTADLFTDSEKFHEAALESVMDMMAVDETTGNNVNLTFENLKISTGLTVSEEKYAESFCNTLTDGYAELGATATCSDPVSVTLAGKTYQKILADVSLNGFSIKQACYVRKTNGYALAIAFTIMDGTAVSDFEAMFS